MPVKVLLQLCSCASDDLKICVTDVLQDHTNSTETELHQVCVCVCVCVWVGGWVWVWSGWVWRVHICDIAVRMIFIDIGD